MNSRAAQAVKAIPGATPSAAMPMAAALRLHHRPPRSPIHPLARDAAGGGIMAPWQGRDRELQRQLTAGAAIDSRRRRQSGTYQLVPRSRMGDLEPMSLP